MICLITLTKLENHEETKLCASSEQCAQEKKRHLFDLIWTSGTVWLLQSKVNLSDTPLTLHPIAEVRGQLQVSEMSLEDKTLFCPKFGFIPDVLSQFITFSASTPAALTETPLSGHICVCVV